MNNNGFEKVFNVIDLYESLERCQFTVGLFENKSKKVSVKVTDLEDNSTEIEMSLEDVLYFTELGTITLPRRPILKPIERWIAEQFGYWFRPIREEIENESITTKEELYARLESFVNFVNLQIPNIISKIISSNATISSLLKEDDTNKYFYNLQNLGKYLKCRLKKV